LHHRFCDDQLDPVYRARYLHRGINVFYSRDTVFDVVLPKDVEVRVERTGPRMRVEYHTPLGMVSTTTHYGVDSQRHGITIPALVEHLIKTPADYAPAGYLFEHMDVVPSFERFRRWAAEEMREDGQPVAIGSFDASPFHTIQRDLSDPTQFFIHYKDHYAEMRGLADRIGLLLDKELAILRDSPAEVCVARTSTTCSPTRPTSRGRSSLIRKAADMLGAAGEARALPHRRREHRTDGPHPRFGRARRRVDHPGADDARHDRRVLPALEPAAHAVRGHTVDDHPAWLLPRRTSRPISEFFRAVAPGVRMVAGIVDEVPPEAVLRERQRTGERIEREGRLPLQAGAFRPVSAAPPAAAGQAAVQAAGDAEETFAEVRKDIFGGKHVAIKPHVQALLDRGVPAAAILEQGLIAAITVVGARMAAGEAFIPEVLCSRRAR
jgi:hypothetical protein